METNRFHQNRYAILERAHSQRETFEISALAWAVDTKQKNYEQELLDWMRYVTDLESGSPDGRNLLPDYFCENSVTSMDE